MWQEEYKGQGAKSHMKWHNTNSNLTPRATTKKVMNKT